MISKTNSLNTQDIKKWAKNTLIFFAPAFIIFLTALQTGTPVKEAAYLIYLWGVNVAIDLLKKYTSVTKY